MSVVTLLKDQYKINLQTMCSGNHDIFVDNTSGTSPLGHVGENYAATEKTKSSRIKSCSVLRKI